MAMKNNNKSFPAERSTMTETTTTEIVSRPVSNKNSKLRTNGRKNMPSRSYKNGSDVRSSRKAWEIRPHEKKFALPTPGYAVNTNDEAWYIGKLKEQAERYGAVPWTAIAGDALTTDSYTAVLNLGAAHADIKLNSVSRTFPSVMVAGLIPALGNTNTQPSRLDMPWMTTAEQKIAYLQSKISGSLPFHAADLVCYWFCAADIFAEIAQAERALKIARTWMTYENLSYPKQLCAAMGWDFNSLMGNVRVVEGMIQEIINLANTLLLPKDLTLVERWFFLYSHVFKDSNLPTAKLYGYRKDGYYTFEEDLYDTGSACEFHAAPCMRNGIRPGGEQAFWTPQTWFETVMNSISKLLPGRSTAVVDIMAKLLRAYDVSTFFAYPNVSSEGIMPKFDPEALTAFANLNMTGVVAINYPEHLDNFNLKQDVDNLVLTYADFLFQPSLYMPDTNLLRAWEAKPTTGSLFEMTRLICCSDGDPTSVDGYMYTGTEIVVSVSIYTGAGESIEERVPYGARTRTMDALGQGAEISDIINAYDFFNLWQRFEYAPLSVLAMLPATTETQINVQASMIADMDNYAVLPRDVLQRIHRIAIANLWGVQTDFIG